MINLDMVKMICQRAAKEPWIHVGDATVVDADGSVIFDCKRQTAVYTRATANALLIATARNLLPELVDEIERLNKDLGELSEENERLSVALKLAQALRADRKSEVEWLKAELDAAKRDIKNMLQRGDPEEFCTFCKMLTDDYCSIDNCNAEWRGATENGGQNERD